VAVIAILTSAREKGRTGPPSALYEIGRNNSLAENLMLRGHEVVMWWDEPAGDLLRSDIDLAILRSGKAVNISRGLALEQQGVLVLNNPSLHDNASDKWKTALCFQRDAIAHPDTHLAKGPVKEIQVVLKTRRGSGGHGVEKIPGTDVPNDEAFIVQPLIEWTDDIRATVINGEVVYSLRRRPAPGEWRTNLAQGSQFEEALDVPDEAKELAVNASESLGLLWSGVDLLLGPDGWVVLEANPGTTLYGATRPDGVRIVDHLATFLESQL